ncbi:33707_t:CDS:2 [Gigaspora margarita]|uniref:33707_t:CDS:1 n=1 Tax=Gigaspora margarita TaxID=4874 RepID=A0ABN7WFN1_GIGMA|nr:33707_t:CDS:2 [Gigaspora margarita]
MGFSLNTSLEQYFKNNLSKEKKERYDPLSTWTCPTIFMKGGKLDLKEFFIEECLETPFTKLDLECLPQLTSLMLERSNLGCLDISECNNLINVNFCENKSALRIKINNLAPIEKLNLSNNTLVDLEFLKNINTKNMTFLSLSYTKLTLQDLSCLREFVNLEVLYLYKSAFYGSLEPLNNMNRLILLSISFTNISSRLEYLGDNISRLYCRGSDQFNVRNIEKLLKKCSDKKVVDENYAEHLKI